MREMTDKDIIRTLTNYVADNNTDDLKKSVRWCFGNHHKVYRCQTGVGWKLFRGAK